MEAALTTQQRKDSIDDSAMLALVSGGDAKALSSEQRIAYYRARCEAAGLDPRTQPFEFTNLNGKLVLYARKAATDQLAAQNGVVLGIVSKETVEGVHVVTVRASTRDGRQTEDVGAVSIAGKKGDDLANALMKAVTKAKRRAVLALCGLGMLDETEIETVPRERPRSTMSDVKPSGPRIVVTEAPAALPPAEPPPHDPMTGEVAEPIAGLAESAEAAMLAELEKGFPNWGAKREWSATHRAAKDALSPEAAERVRQAFLRAKPRRQEAP